MGRAGELPQGTSEQATKLLQRISILDLFVSKLKESVNAPPPSTEPVAEFTDEDMNIADGGLTATIDGGLLCPPLELIGSKWHAACTAAAHGGGLGLGGGAGGALRNASMAPCGEWLQCQLGLRPVPPGLTCADVASAARPVNSVDMLHGTVL